MMTTTSISCPASSMNWSSLLWLLVLSHATAFDIPQTKRSSSPSTSRIPRKYASEAVTSRPDQLNLVTNTQTTRRRNQQNNINIPEQEPDAHQTMMFQTQQRENNHHRLLQSSQYQTASVPHMEVLVEAAPTTASVSSKTTTTTSSRSTTTNSRRSSSTTAKSHHSLFWAKQHPKKQRLLAKLIKQNQEERQQKGHRRRTQRGSSSSSSISTTKKKLRVNNMMQRASHQHARVKLTTSAHWTPSLHDKDDAEGPSASSSSSPPSSSSALLTKDEEMQYASQLKIMREVIRTRDELVKEQDGMYIHPTEEEWAAACKHVDVESVYELRKIMVQGQEARSILCEANVGLVTSIAKRHYKTLKHTTDAGNGSVGTILTLHDMIQEGNLGLMEAAERFEPQRGFRFSTYATWWIRQRILRSISDSSRVIRLPAHVHGMLHKIRRARLEIQAAQGGKPASLEQLAQTLGVSLEKVQKYTESSRNVVSLEVPLSANIKPSNAEPNLRTLGDTLASDAPTPVEDAEAEYLKRDIRHVIQTELAEKERDVILRRFGFIEKTLHEPTASATSSEGEVGTAGKRKRKLPSRGGSCFTVAQTAEALGLSVDRVRLIEARALNKLRSPQRNYRLREYVNQGGGASNSPSLSYLHSLNNRSSKKGLATSASAASASNNPSNGHATSDPDDIFPMMSASSNGSRHKVKSGKNTHNGKINRHPNGGTVDADTREKNKSRDHRESNSDGPNQATRPDRMWFF